MSFINGSDSTNVNYLIQLLNDVLYIKTKLNYY